MITYERRGQAIVIKDGLAPEIVLNIPNLRQAISNIQVNRLNYATEVAYQAHLAKYQGALRFAEVKCDRNS